MTGRYSIVFDEERCVACGACAAGCADQNDIAVKSLSDMFRKVTTEERMTAEGAVFSWRSAACLHCDPSPCVEACPMGCLYKDKETGFTVYDNTECIGCRLCGEVCPVGAPTYTEEGKMRKCDGCNARVKDGREPACVRVCPFDALRLEGGTADL